MKSNIIENTSLTPKQELEVTLTTLRELSEVYSTSKNEYVKGRGDAYQIAADWIEQTINKMRDEL